MMEIYHPKYAFLAYGIWGVILFIISFFLSKEAEIEFIPGEEVISHYSSELVSNQTPSEAAAAKAKWEAERPPRGEEGFWFNFKKNMKLLWKAL